MYLWKKIYRNVTADRKFFQSQQLEIHRFDLNSRLRNSAAFIVALNVKATIAAALCWFKILHPCTFRKKAYRNRSYNIFLYFYFSTLNSVCTVTYTNDIMDRSEQTVLILQFLNKISTLAQAFLYEVLILIGFYTCTCLRHGEMPV